MVALNLQNTVFERSPGSTSAAQASAQSCQFVRAKGNVADHGDRFAAASFGLQFDANRLAGDAGGQCTTGLPR